MIFRKPINDSLFLDENCDSKFVPLVVVLSVEIKYCIEGWKKANATIETLKTHETTSSVPQLPLPPTSPSFNNIFLDQKQVFCQYGFFGHCLHL